MHKKIDSFIQKEVDSDKRKLKIGDRRDYNGSLIKYRKRQADYVKDFNQDRKAYLETFLKSQAP